MKIQSIFNPILFLGIYFLLVFLIKGIFPDPKSFIEVIKNVYSVHGYSLIFFGALLEGLFLIGFYVPGSTVVILGAAFARTGIVSYPLVFLIGTAGLVLSYIINYFLGRYGWYHVLSKIGFKKGIESAKHRLTQNQTKTIALGYFFPGSASFLSLAAGILHIPFKRFLFLSILAQSFWSFLWGNLAYWLGLPFVEFVFKYFFIIFILIAVFWLIRKFIKRKSSPLEP